MKHTPRLTNHGFIRFSLLARITAELILLGILPKPNNFFPHNVAFRVPIYFPCHSAFRWKSTGYRRLSLVLLADALISRFFFTHNPLFNALFSSRTFCLSIPPMYVFFLFPTRRHSPLLYRGKGI